MRSLSTMASEKRSPSAASLRRCCRRPARVSPPRRVGAARRSRQRSLGGQWHGAVAHASTIDCAGCPGMCVAAQAPAPACAPPGQAGKRRCDAGATHTVASPHPHERQGRGPAHLKLKVLELRVGRALGNNAACRVGGVRARLLSRCALLVRAFPAVVAVRHPQLTGSAPLQRMQISGTLDELGRVFDAVQRGWRRFPGAATQQN